MDEPVSVQVVQRVAARDDVDPVDLTPPLYDVIDADALDALFHATNGDRSTTNGAVKFTYRGYLIRVTGEGDVHVTESTSSYEEGSGSIKPSAE